MADKKKDDKETDGDKNTSKDQIETDALDTARNPEAEGKKKDSQETTVNDAVAAHEREPWSVLDIPRAFACAGNGSAMVAAALLIFVILIGATIPRYIGITVDKSFTDYIFNGLALLVLICGLSVALGTLSKVHAAILTGGTRMSIADTMGYVMRHGLDLILSPIQIIIMTAVVAGIEVGLFFLAKIPYIYGVLFFPLVILTMILLGMSLMLYVFITLSAPAVAVGGFHGRGAFDKARRYVRKKTARVAGYSLLNALVTGLVGLVVFGLLAGILWAMHDWFVNKILIGEAVKYYTGALGFLVNLGKTNISTIKSVTFLVSAYVTLAFFGAYVLSLFSALNTIAYLALEEEQAEV